MPRRRSRRWCQGSRPPPDAAALARTVALSRTTALGVYDAVYLELASRDGAELASRDTALLAACAAAGLAVHDLR